MYGKIHLGECLIGKERCLGCGQSSQILRDYPSKHGKRGNNGRAQSTTSAKPIGLLTH